MSTWPQQGPAGPCIVNFGTEMCNVFAQKMTVDVLDNKIDDSVQGFYLPAWRQTPWLRIRVASGGEICMRNAGTYKIKTNLVSFSTKSTGCRQI
jgi:hypothetical protein